VAWNVFSMFYTIVGASNIVIFSPCKSIAIATVIKDV
jgi:hypothetical protein